MNRNTTISRWLGAVPSTGAAVFVLMALFTAPAQAQSSWVHWSGNGHYYMAVHTPAGVTWSQARQHAIALGADLATITSAPENDFAFSLVNLPQFWRQASNPDRLLGPWLGGQQLPGAPNAAAWWTWVSGEPWGFDNWSAAEPNDYNGANEDRLQFFSPDLVRRKQWNDIVGDGLMFGFVAESTVLPPTTYCTAGTSGAGCTALISATAQPSASASTSCILDVATAEGQRLGLFFYGINNTGFAPSPWGNSTSFLCVKAPVQRTPPQPTGGASLQCNGSMVLDWNGFQQAHPGALGKPWTPGEHVWVQAWYRDPAAPPPTTVLSNALQLTVLP